MVSQLIFMIKINKEQCYNVVIHICTAHHKSHPNPWWKLTFLLLLQGKWPYYITTLKQLGSIILFKWVPWAPFHKGLRLIASFLRTRFAIELRLMISIIWLIVTLCEMGPWFKHGRFIIGWSITRRLTILLQTDSSCLTITGLHDGL